MATLPLLGTQLSKMAFFISKPARQTLATESDHVYSGPEKAIPDSLQSPQFLNPVTTELHLVSSAKDSSKSMDKETVLRRIRHHKRLIRVRGALRAAVMGGPGLERRWLEDPEDAFSSP